MADEQILHPFKYTLHVIFPWPAVVGLERPVAKGADVMEEAQRCLGAYPSASSVEVYSDDRRLFVVMPDGRMDR